MFSAGLAGAVAIAIEITLRCRCSMSKIKKLISSGDNDQLAEELEFVFSKDPDAAYGSLGGVTALSLTPFIIIIWCLIPESNTIIRVLSALLCGIVCSLLFSFVAEKASGLSKLRTDIRSFLEIQNPEFWKQIQQKWADQAMAKKKKEEDERRKKEEMKLHKLQKREEQKRAAEEAFRLPKQQRSVSQDDIGARPSLNKNPSITENVAARISGYRIIRKLGEGGMGVVYEAIQESLDRRVALKLLPYSLTVNAEFVQRFKREAKATASLNHPNIVTIYEIGEQKGLYYFSMEFINGESLETRLKRQKRLSNEDAFALLKQAVNGFDHAWSKAIIHRDIKPSNLMLTRDNILKITDFGLAKALAGLGDLTMTGMVFGTPYYMSPEQASNAKEVDFRADIYSLGATFYHLVAGQVPFDGSSPLEIAIKTATTPLRPIGQINDAISPGLALIIEKMMARHPEDRYQSADQLSKALSCI